MNELDLKKVGVRGINETRHTFGHAGALVQESFGLAFEPGYTPVAFDALDFAESALERDVGPHGLDEVCEREMSQNPLR